MTDAEEIVWEALRAKRFLSLKFRRQMPLVLGEYHVVVDFYCSRLKLVIEIDGSIHQRAEVKDYDALREEILRLSGYRIFRCTNSDVRNNIAIVLDRLERLIYTISSVY